MGGGGRGSLYMDYIDTKLQFIPQMIDMIVFAWHVPKRQL